MRLYDLTDKQKNPKFASGVRKIDIEKVLSALTDQNGNKFKPLYQQFSKISLMGLLEELRKHLKDQSAHEVDKVISSLNSQLFSDLDIGNVQKVAERILERLVLRRQWRNTEFGFIDCPSSSPFC